jgi:RHS repeat-associated protein
MRPAACASRYTGKERDAESGLDNFGARYDSSSLGRFMSPDWSARVEPVPYSKLDDPQSLNLYSYVLNNPLSNVDTDGQHAHPKHLGFPLNLQPHESEIVGAVSHSEKSIRGETVENCKLRYFSSFEFFDHTGIARFSVRTEFWRTTPGSNSADTQK